MTPVHGGPAFPSDTFRATEFGPSGATHTGMSLRDYFAAKALQGMLAYPGDQQRGSHHNNNTPNGVAAMAYEYADALLDAREVKS